MSAQAADKTPEVGVSVQVVDLTEVGGSVQVDNITETGVSVQVADNAKLGVSVQVADIPGIGVSVQAADVTSFCFFVLFTAALQDSSPLAGSIDSNGSQSFNLPFDYFVGCFLLSFWQVKPADRYLKKCSAGPMLVTALQRTASFACCRCSGRTRWYVNEGFCCCFLLQI